MSEYPELVLVDDPDSSAMRIETKDGEAVVIDTVCNGKTLQRLVDCWNECRKFPDPVRILTSSEALREDLARWKAERLGK